MGRILDGTLRPGEPLSEAELTDDLQSSRTPIREALVALEQDGLVKRFPQRGWFVTEINVKDIEEVSDLRLLLEVWALKKAYNLIPKQELLVLYGRLKSLDDSSTEEAYFEADRDLHQMIVYYCGNRRLNDVLNTINMQIERVRIMSSKKPERLLNSRNEHIEIVEAILAEDVQKAENLLIEHIGHVKESMIEVSRYYV